MTFLLRVYHRCLSLHKWQAVLCCDMSISPSACFQSLFSAIVAAKSQPQEPAVSSLSRTWARDPHDLLTTLHL